MIFPGSDAHDGWASDPEATPNRSCGSVLVLGLLIFSLRLLELALRLRLGGGPAVGVGTGAGRPLGGGDLGGLGGPALVVRLLDPAVQDGAQSLQGRLVLGVA